MQLAGQSHFSAVVAGWQETCFASCCTPARSAAEMPVCSTCHASYPVLQDCCRAGLQLPWGLADNQGPQSDSCLRISGSDGLPARILAERCHVIGSARFCQPIKKHVRQGGRERRCSVSGRMAASVILVLDRPTCRRDAMLHSVSLDKTDSKGRHPATMAVPGAILLGKVLGHRFA